MSEVSEILYEFYRSNGAAKASKQQSILGAAVANYRPHISPTSTETQPSVVAAFATNGSALETVSNNLSNDGMMSDKVEPTSKLNLQKGSSLYPRIKYTLKTVPNSDLQMPITAIPTSVVVPPQAVTEESLDIKPIINPVSGMVMVPNPVVGNPNVIKPVPNTQAAAIAAAFLRDGYHNFQQQIRAQELLKFQTSKFQVFPKLSETDTNAKILEAFLRQQCNSEGNATGNDNANEVCDSKVNGFDDIHLMEVSKPNPPQMLQNTVTNNSGTATPGSSDYISDESQKYVNVAAPAQVQAFPNLDFKFGNDTPNEKEKEGPFHCKNCDKKYRWKSTLRRHENVECGNKEPSFQCPYCGYKSKQHGNLGVHVRKHHADKPQLESKRRSKYSKKSPKSSRGSANVSDDSNSKVIIDCSK